MEWIQAAPRPCHHHRFPIRLVRRPPPSGTPPSLEQTSQPQTTLMNWRWAGGTQLIYLLTSISLSCKRLRNRFLKPIIKTKSPPFYAQSCRNEWYDFSPQILEVYCASDRSVNRRTIVNQSGRCGKHSLFLARAMAIVGHLCQLADRRMEQEKR